MRHSGRPSNRLASLLADRALFGLDSAAATQLDNLLREHPEVESESFELAAAACCLAFDPGPHEPLPADVAAKIKTRWEHDWR